MAHSLRFSPPCSRLSYTYIYWASKAWISNLSSTAIRTLVVFFMAMGMVYLTGAKVSLAEISTKTWVFLVLSGLATGASWLCYFKALQIGDVSKVAPIDKTSIIFTIIMAVDLSARTAYPEGCRGRRAHLPQARSSWPSSR